MPTSVTRSWLESCVHGPGWQVKLQPTACGAEKVAEMLGCVSAARAPFWPHDRASP